MENASFKRRLPGFSDGGKFFAFKPDSGFHCIVQTFLSITGSLCLHLPCGSGTELGFAGNTVTGGRDWAGVWKGAEGVVCPGGIAGADNERSKTLEHPLQIKFAPKEINIEFSFIREYILIRKNHLLESPAFFNKI